MSDKKMKKKVAKKVAKKKIIRKSGLGRGLDALLGQRSEQSTASELQSMDIEMMQPGQYQPRSIMDQEKLRELSESIKAQGIVQPIVVRQLTTNQYEIIAGERRWRAAQLAGLRQVPVLVKQVDDQQTIAMALIENIQREDLSPLEEANALQRLIDEFELTHAQAADAVGRSRVAVSNLLRLLDLNPQVKDMLNDGLLEMGHARCLLSVDAVDQRKLALEIVAKKMTVRKAEQLVKQFKAPMTSPAPRMDKSADVLHLEKSLTEKLCARVEIHAKSKGKGKMVIHFHDADELEGILGRIK